MKHLLFILLLLSSWASSAQTIDESKYLFLLDLKEDTLCIDCRISNCPSLFYNAHMFTRLKHLTIYNLDYDLTYIEHFKKLKILEIYHPDTTLIDIPKIAKKVANCKRLRSLSVSRAVCNYGTMRKKARHGYFKKLSKLKTLKLHRTYTNNSNLLVKDITWNCRDLDTLVLTRSGAHIFNYPMKNRGFLFFQQEKIGPNLKYLKIDGNLNTNQIANYIAASTYDFDTLDSPRDSLRDRLKRYARIRHLELADNPTVGTWSTERDERIMQLYYKYIFKVWNNHYSIRSMSLNGSNASYKSNFYFYKRVVERNSYVNNVSDPLYSQKDSADMLTYIGDISTGEDENTNLLPWLVKYDKLRKLPVNWDTNSISTRKQNCGYANGFITPIRWTSVDQAPKYFSKNKMTKIAEDYQSVVSLKQVKKKNGQRYYQIVFRKDLKGNLSPQLDFTKYNSSTGFNSLKNYSITIKSKRKERVLTSENILDAWPTFNEEDSIYYLVYKTPKRLDSTKINWWKLNTDTLEFDFTKRMKSMQREQIRRESIITRRSSRSERSISKARYGSRKKGTSNVYWNSPLGRKGLPHYPTFYQELNKYRAENDLKPISKEKWETIYSSFCKNPWPYYANSMFSSENLPNALTLKGFAEMDETSWYKQYSAVELFNANPNNNTYKAGLTKVLIMDYVKKTYMTTEIKYSYYINRNGVQDFHFILPKSYNPNIKIVILGYANGFYCSKPHFNYKRFSNTTFDLEEMPLNLIDFETFFEIIEE